MQTEKDAYESGMDIAYLIQRYCPGVTNPVLGLLWWAAMGVEGWRLYAAWHTGAFDWTCIAPMGGLLLALAVQAASCDGLLDVDDTRWGSFHPLLAVMMTCGGLASLAGGDSPELLAFVFFTAYLAVAAAADGVVLYLTR